MASPLADYLKVQKATDQAILSTLRASAASIDSELRRLQSRTGVGAAIRREQLLMSQVAMQREMERLWTRVGDIVEVQKAVAAGAAAEGVLRDSSVLSSLFSAADRDYMARSAAATAARGLEAVERRLEGSSYVPLKESVYNNAALSSGKIDEIVNSALARGASAAELARDVRAYVNPNTPGGVRYASLRLGRTEINNSFHASQVKEAQKSPWVTAVRWWLSGSHSTPDECNEYAESVHFEGGTEGQFRPNDVPAKPHPQCLCFTTPDTVDRDEFIKQFEAGRYDEYLEENFPDLPLDNASKKAVNTPTKTPASSTPVNKVGSDELSRQMAAAEQERLALEKARYIQKGRGKGNFNPERGYTSDAARARQNYSESLNRDMNELKRNPEAFLAKNASDPSWVEYVSSQNDLVEELFKKNALDQDVTVARFMKGDFGNLSEGGYMADPGFLSTTTDLKSFLSSPSRAYEESSAQSWTFIIRAPKGTPALPGADYQKELFFGPGTRQRILSVDKANRTVYTEIV